MYYAHTCILYVAYSEQYAQLLMYKCLNRTYCISKYIIRVIMLLTICKFTQFFLPIITCIIVVILLQETKTDIFLVMEVGVCS